MNKGTPLITTIIPTYRRPGLLRRALRSVLNQTYPHVCACVYDNASGDETAAMVAEMAKQDPRIRYHCHAESIGALRNFVYGQERVETPYYSFLSDDDVLLPNFYEDALRGFERFPEAWFSALGAVFMRTREGLGIEVPPEGWPEGLCRPPDSLRKMFKISQPSWTAILFRKECIDRDGLLDLEAGYASDNDYVLRVAARHPVAVYRRPAVLRVVHLEAAGVQARLEDYFPGIIKMSRNLAGETTLDAPTRAYVAAAVNRMAKRRLLVDWGLRAVVAGRDEEARRSAEMLGDEFADGGRARLVRAAAALHRAFPPLRRASSWGLEMRRDVLNAWRSTVVRKQRECFRTYAIHLDAA